MLYKREKRCEQILLTHSIWIFCAKFSTVKLIHFQSWMECEIETYNIATEHIRLDQPHNVNALCKRQFSAFLTILIKITFGAISAFIRLFATMLKTMVDKMIFSRECCEQLVVLWEISLNFVNWNYTFATKATLKWLFSCMLPAKNAIIIVQH